MNEAPPTVPGPQTMMVPHRGGVILALGILSIVFGGGCGIGLILGIIGWSMANRDIREMDDGIKDASGRGTVQAGKICSIIGVCLGALGFIIGMIYLVFFVLLAAAAAAGGA
jgi:hypothetical protein